MAIQKATKNSVKLLQKIFDTLGKYGGTIVTKEPGSWWNLYVDADDSEVEGKITSQIGVYKDVNSDIMFDPIFKIQMEMDGDRIKNADIFYCEATTIFGTTHIDGNNILTATFSSEREKDDIGLKERFEGFLINMAEEGPYLSDPAEVKKYTKYLSAD